MALIGTQKDLAEKIAGVLSKKSGADQAALKVQEVDFLGTVKDKTYALSSGKGQVSCKTKKNPKTGAGVNGSDITGAEAMAMIIADKIIDHILENFELAALPRLDKLEDDYNNLLIGLTTAGGAGIANPLTAPLGVALTAAVLTAGTPGRASVTALKRVKEKVKTKGGELL